MNLSLPLKPFKIKNEHFEHYSRKIIQEWMNLQNLSSGVEFYMVDCYHQKIFVHSSKSKVLCGYSKKTLEEEGLGFYNLIFKSDDIQWLKKMYEKASDLFYTFPLSARKKIEIFYDLPVIKKMEKNFLCITKLFHFNFARMEMRG